MFQTKQQQKLAVQNFHLPSQKTLWIFPLFLMIIYVRRIDTKKRNVTVTDLDMSKSIIYKTDRKPIYYGINVKCSMVEVGWWNQGELYRQNVAAWKKLWFRGYKSITFKFNSVFGFVLAEFFLICLYCVFLCPYTTIPD